MNRRKSQQCRSRPVAGFEAIQICYFVDEDVIDIIRILRGERDVKHILEREGAF